MDIGRHCEIRLADIAMLAVSHHSFLPLGFCVWIVAYFELALSNDLEHQLNRVHGRQASYFAAYFICSLTISSWIVRKYGFRVTFMTGKLEDSFRFRAIGYILTVWVSLRSFCACRWMSSVLAKWREEVIWWILR